MLDQMSYPNADNLSSIILTHDNQYWILVVVGIFTCQYLLGQSILLRDNRLWESSFSCTKTYLCLTSLHYSELYSLWNGPDETYSFWIAALSETGDWYYLPVNLLLHNGEELGLWNQIELGLNPVFTTQSLLILDKLLTSSESISSVSNGEIIAT